MALVWDVLESDFPKLVEGCERYCDDNGIALLATWREEAPVIDDSTEE